jgi:hypothetical protein
MWELFYVGSRFMWEPLQRRMGARDWLARCRGIAAEAAPTESPTESPYRNPPQESRRLIRHSLRLDHSSDLTPSCPATNGLDT